MTVELTLAQRFEIAEQIRRDRLYKEMADAVEQVFEEREKAECSR